MMNKIIDKISEWNPQLFRELKGRLTNKNLGIAAVISLIGQGFIYMMYQAALPSPKYHSDFNRYCLGNIPLGWEGYKYSYNGNNFCLNDALGNVKINWQIWNLDVFVTLSIIAIFVVLIAGSYLLITDLSKEEQRGTLNFIRLSPQTAQSIFTGKMLGVPALVYAVCLLALPWHFIAGLLAHIHLALILSFYLVFAASCAFFFSLSLFYGIISTGLAGFKAWLGSGALLYVISMMTVVAFSSNVLVGNTMDWSLLFYPGTTLTYLVNSTNLGDTVGYFNLSIWTELSWFGINLCSHPISGIGFILVNYGVGTYWLSQALKRRFYNPNATPLTKKQSYLLTAIITLVMLGFNLKNPSWTSYDEGFFINITFLVCLNFFIALGLIVILSPQRQDLQDWARYHHQNKEHGRNLLKDLLFGIKSPANLAVVVNFVIASLITLPAILLLPLGKYRIALLCGLVLQLTLLAILATISQKMLMLKTKKRAMFAGSVIGTLIFLPLIIAGIFQIDPTQDPLMWLFTIVPMMGAIKPQLPLILFSIIGQSIAIAMLNLSLTKNMQKLGESSTKSLLGVKS